jgi:2-oxoglutarate dehydrogenase E1 component
MDRFSFLNAAHTQFFADLYEQYSQIQMLLNQAGEHSFKVSTLGWQTYNEENIGEQIVTYAANTR